MRLCGLAGMSVEIWSQRIIRVVGSGYGSQRMRSGTGLPRVRVEIWSQRIIRVVGSGYGSQRMRSGTGLAGMRVEGCDCDN